MFSLLRRKGRNNVRFSSTMKHYEILWLKDLSVEFGNSIKTVFCRFMQECENEYAIHPENWREDFVLPTTLVYTAIFYRYQEERKKCNNSSHFLKHQIVYEVNFQDINHLSSWTFPVTSLELVKLPITGCNLIIIEGKAFAKLFKISPQPYLLPQFQVNPYPYPKSTPLSDTHAELLPVSRKQHCLSCWS